MSRNVAPIWVVPLITAFAIAGLAPFGAWAQAPGQTWTQSGMLRCRLNPSIGFVIFGHQSMECQFVPSHQRAPQRYERALNTVGIDIGVVGTGGLRGLSWPRPPVSPPGPWPANMSEQVETLPSERASEPTF